MKKELAHIQYVIEKRWLLIFIIFYSATPCWALKSWCEYVSFTVCCLVITPYLGSYGNAYVCVVKLTLTCAATCLILFPTLISTNFACTLSGSQCVPGICWGANLRLFLMKQQWSRWDFRCPHHLLCSPGVALSKRICILCVCMCVCVCVCV